MAGRRAARARPPRARSQHFLRSSALAADLVRDAAIGRDELIVEIGAGRGRLTAELARVARTVIAVEVDPLLARSLRDRWTHVDVVEGDATRIALPSEPFRVVANVPFHRTTAILHSLLDDPRTPLTRADLILEWAVAVRRGLPWPSTVNDVVWGAFYDASVSRRLPPAAFEPPPSVHAGVVVFRRRAEALVPPALVAEYHRFVAHGFRRGIEKVRGREQRTTLVERGATGRDLDAHAWAALFLGDRRRPRRTRR